MSGEGGRASRLAARIRAAEKRLADQLGPVVPLHQELIGHARRCLRLATSSFSTGAYEECCASAESYLNRLDEELLDPSPPEPASGVRVDGGGTAL